MELIILGFNYNYLIIAAFYAKHLQALKDAGIMTNISDPNATEMRGWVMLMLERAAETVNPSECNDPAVLLACSLGSDSCPAACRDNTDETTVDDNGNVIKVKSGDLQISAAAAEGRKVALNGGISDLDTITLKASEAITLNSVTLERFGFSSYKDVKNIWLENSNGVKIANEKSISSTKDTVTLNIKKEYRELNSEDTITVVLETESFGEDTICTIETKNSDGTKKADEKIACPSNTVATSVEGVAHTWAATSTYSLTYGDIVVQTGAASALATTIPLTKTTGNAGYSISNAGSTIGFKVVSVESSAKNLNIDNYNPYLYDMVTYDSSNATVTVKGKDATYHYNNGNAYELARFQVKAGSAAVAVNGFTLTNDATLAGTNAGKSRVDLDKFVDEVIVSLSDGTKVSNVKFDANKDDELKVSFDEVEVAINKNVIFVVEVVFKDFDDYGKVVALQLKNSGDLNVVEKKTGARANVQNIPAVMKQYLFQGGKIEVANEKLADTIDASVGSTNITIGKGKITLAGESIELNKFTIGTTQNGAAIESLKMLVNGDEYEAKKDGTNFTFDKVTIDENSTIEFTVDIVDNDTYKNVKVVFANSFDKNTLKEAGADKLGRYEEARTDITSADWAGSISLSNVRIQAAKGSLSAGSNKDVEILEKQTSRKTIFEGTYTAQKQDVYLNGFAVKGSTAKGDSDITYYLSIDGKEVGSFDYLASTDDDATFIKNNEQGFSDILIKKDEKVSVKLEANVYGIIPAGDSSTTYPSTLIIRGTDKDGNEAGFASESTAKVKVVKAGSVTVSDSAVTPKEGVALNDTNITLARFTVKSSKNSEGMTLTNFKLKPTETSDDGTTWELGEGNIRIRVAGSELTETVSPIVGDFTVSNGIITVDGLSEDIPAAGVDVEVIIKKLPKDSSSNDILGKYAVTLDEVNSSKPAIKFSKLIVKSIASIKSQENRGDSTTKFTFFVDKDDDNKTVKNLVLFTSEADTATPANDVLASVEDGTTLEITNQGTVQFIQAIAYSIEDTPTPATITSATTLKNLADSGKYIIIKKSEYRDFFKVGDAEAQIFRTK